jgi:hypothetical protein
MIKSVYDVRIDWPTAETVARGGGLELTVALSAEPDTFWTNACSVLSDRLSRETGRGLYVNTPFGMQLIAGGWDPGDEDRVKGLLDELVVAVNQRAASDRQQWEARQRQQQADAERLDRAAEDATGRFRSE